MSHLPSSRLHTELRPVHLGRFLAIIFEWLEVTGISFHIFGDCKCGKSHATPEGTREGTFLTCFIIGKLLVCLDLGLLLPLSHDFPDFYETASLHTETLSPQLGSPLISITRGTNSVSVEAIYIGFGSA